MAFKVKCEFLKDGDCASIASNDEAKEVRKISCSNDNEQACCYLCSRYQGCEISCDFIGENKNKSQNKQPPDSIEKNKIRVLKCPLCNSKMIHSEIKLRIGGWSGIMQALPLGSLGELGEELLPVVLYVCPKCGKLELVAQEKTKQKIIDRS
jgi:hypothetical protein